VTSRSKSQQPGRRVAERRMVESSNWTTERGRWESPTVGAETVEWHRRRNYRNQQHKEVRWPSPRVAMASGDIMAGSFDMDMGVVHIICIHLCIRSTEQT